MTHRLDLLDPLVYADTFDCALTLEEMWRYARVSIGTEELSRALRDDESLRRVVLHRRGLYALADRPQLIDQRPARVARARALQRRGRGAARVLRHLPFVRGLALTGSLAADDAGDHADVDLLVTVAPGRLATAFLMMGPVARVLRGRVFCPNYYVNEGRLGMARDDPYVARELVQARALAGSTRGLHESNPWLAHAFPNAAHESGMAAGAGLQRALEQPLRGRIGDAVERLAVRVAESRLRAHYGACGDPVPDDVAASLAAGVALRFHGRHTSSAIVSRYAARRAEVAEMLEAGILQRT